MQTFARDEAWRNSSSLAVTLDRCRACGGSTFESLARPTTWIGDSVFESVRSSIGLTRCDECSFVFVNPRPSPELIQSFYNVDNYDCHEHDNPANCPSTRLEHVLDLLEPFKPSTSKSGRLLDFGCGGGYFVKTARERGWDAIGYDIGKRSRAVCAELGVPLVEELSALEQEQFHLISLHHVFEHIDDHDAFFETIDPLVGERTLVYIEVPNVHSLRARLAAPALTSRLPIDERFRAFPIHLSYFSFSTLAQILDRYGYRIVADFNFGVGLDEYFTELPNFLASNRNGLTGARERSDAGSGNGGGRARSNRAVQALKDIVKRTLWKLRLGENLAVIAQKERRGCRMTALSSRRRAAGSAAEQLCSTSGAPD